MKPILLICCIVLAASAVVIGVPPAAAELTVAGGETVHAPRLPKNHEEVRQAIFFAVLEGLYNDGVDTETAKLLSAVDKETGAPRYFVYSCPICMPALDAVRLYAGRPGFYGSKSGKDTFGKGLSEVTRAQLAMDDPQVRIATFQALILGWMHEYMENMRLTPDEHEHWARWLSDLREKGNARLEQYLEEGGPYAEVYRGWEKCPACEGSNGAMGN